MLNKNNNVTAMNKEIYMMDLEEKMKTDEEIDAEKIIWIIFQMTIIWIVIMNIKY